MKTTAQIAEEATNEIHRHVLPIYDWRPKDTKAIIQSAIEKAMKERDKRDAAYIRMERDGK